MVDWDPDVAVVLIVTNWYHRIQQDAAVRNRGQYLTLDGITGTPSGLNYLGNGHRVFIGDFTKDEFLRRKKYDNDNN